MRLAIETATDCASIAIGRRASDAVERELSGARRHAAELLPMIDATLRQAGATLEDLSSLVLSDGPGSFTGLRVGAALAKALAHARGLPLWTAPSLMVRAHGVARDGAIVLAVADALRGELYAAAYRFDGDTVTTLMGPSVYRPDDLARSAPRPDILVGAPPDSARRTLEEWAASRVIVPPLGSPHARSLLGLVDLAGGAARVERVEEWEPVYGRPAEAQARWETAHGRPLPDSIGSPR
jgi:tRNA threonylcarbamoyladenosine biosynthesis protein TsaB